MGLVVKSAPSFFKHKNIMVTVSSLRAYGYALSNLKDEGAITLAENDVKFAYFPTTELFEDQSVIDLLHALTYSLLLRRKTVVTRYGSVQKVSQYTIAAENDAITSEVRSYCMARLEKYVIAINENVDPCTGTPFEINDIIKIYDTVFIL